MTYEDAAIAAKYLIKTNYIFKVVQFHPETQTVDVIQDVLEYCNEPNGNIVINNEFGIDVTAGLLEPDYFVDVPVLQLRWGQFAVQCCPKEGDTGVLMVFTNDIHNWKKDGGFSIPNTDNHFMKSSCVFVPFIPNNVSCASDYPLDNTSLVIRSPNASITLTDNGTTSDVKISADTITMETQNGTNITGDVNVTGTVTATEVVAGNIPYTTHVHESAAPGSPTSGPMAATPPTPGV